MWTLASTHVCTCAYPCGGQTLRAGTGMCALMLTLGGRLGARGTGRLAHVPLCLAYLGRDGGGGFYACLLSPKGVPWGAVSISAQSGCTGLPLPLTFWIMTL